MRQDSAAKGLDRVNDTETCRWLFLFFGKEIPKWLD
nr:MAG TPA: Xin repeat protein [Caudoviricetes sp.]